MQVLLADGGLISGSYNDDIAVSYDGVQWNYYKKAEITAVKSLFSKSNSVMNKGRANKATIVICTNGGEIKFDCQDLSVGTGLGQWTASDAAGTIAGLQNVKDTINGWL